MESDLVVALVAVLAVTVLALRVSQGAALDLLPGRLAEVGSAPRTAGLQSLDCLEVEVETPAWAVEVAIRVVVAQAD